MSPKWINPAVILGAICIVLPLANAHALDLGIFDREATSVRDNAIERKEWSAPSATRIQNKRFQKDIWKSPQSSINTGRTARGFDGRFERKRFATRTKDFPRKEMEISRWNDRLSSLQTRAGIETANVARDIAEEELYSMMLQDARNFEDLAEKASLRDINRFQFRRNRSDDGIPVEAIDGKRSTERVR